MACYPCTLCNKCGKHDALLALGRKCPACGTPFERAWELCEHCGYALLLPPGVSPRSSRLGKPDGMGGSGKVIPMQPDPAASERRNTWQEGEFTVVRGNARTAPGCHDNCGILMCIDKDGKLDHVEGDPEDPYNQGRLCLRCLTLPDYIYHEDRQLYPMKRDRACG